ncbi:AraC family transcriptional regulator [Anaerotaenia torta]|uniref:helix-turn-helix domain-containing protein n=1 Tax=Anaerotaenia torta TaxID=433293 RepID=UPI003D1ABB52
MDNYLLEIIKNTTEFIEDNILEPINLDVISENVNISKFHLLRIWKGATATGLMEYVRLRRIALSLGDLLNERCSIDFIASKYSFGSERAYNRVFKEAYHTTPAKWRRKPVSVKILDRFNADFMDCAGEGLIFFRSITVRPAFTVAGLEYLVGIEENLQTQISNHYGNDFFYNHRHRVMNPTEKDAYIGLTLHSGCNAGYTRYLPSIEVNDSSIIPPDMTVKHIKAHKYGVFTYMGPHRPEEISSKTLKSIWQYVNEVWMPTVEFHLEEDFHFEYIPYSRCNKQYCECELYYPISVLQAPGKH